MTFYFFRKGSITGKMFQLSHVLKGHILSSRKKIIFIYVN